MLDELTLQIPADWAGVHLQHYAQFASATTLRGRAEAVAAMVGADAAQLSANVRLYGSILSDMPWLTEAPPEADPLDEFKHAGKTYVFVGNLQTIDCGQFEALTELLAAHQGQSAAAGPALLAVLYRRKGAEQTAETVEAATAAFQTLPVSVAWPALAFFLRVGWSCAHSFHSSLVLRERLLSTLTALEQHLPESTGPRRFSLKPLPWLTRTWMRSVRGML